MCLDLMLKLAFAGMSDCVEILVSIPIPVKLVDAKKIKIKNSSSWLKTR